MNSCPITLWGRCIERWSNPASYPTAMAGYENLAGFRSEPGPDVISGATLVITAGRCYVHTASNVMFRILHHCHDSALCHIFGVAHPGGGHDPEFELGRDFCAMHLLPKFHHPMFSHSEVTMLTNTSTNKQTNRFSWKRPAFFARLRRWVMTN